MCPLLVPLVLSCSKEEAPPVSSGGTSWRPDLVCPGDAGCEDADGDLMAGAAAVAITPPCFETWEDTEGDAVYSSSTDPFLDCGCDRLCPEDEGWTAADDGEGDGEFQAVWLAGFYNGRAAAGVHDDLWARAVAFRKGSTTIAIVGVDLVGYFHDEVLEDRRAIADEGIDVDHVIVFSTHVHEGPDTMGLWGKNPTHTGVDSDYLDFVRSGVVEAVREAVDALEPAVLTVGKADVSSYDDDQGNYNVVSDHRDPVCIDEWLNVAHLAAADGTTIATLVNWGNHPETLASQNLLITSDYPHYLREGVEDGVGYESLQREGLGGVCLFVTASLGGMMTPLGVSSTDPDGVSFSESNYEKAQAIGSNVAIAALDAVANGEVVDNPVLAVRMRTFFLPIDNFGFQAMSLIGLLDRATYHWDTAEDISDWNIPELMTETDLLELGPIRALTIPGEVLPELAVGGYDGSRIHAPGVEVVSADNPNPPDLEAAPAPPYWKDLAGGDHPWIVGLGNDEIGYIIPPYDFELDETSPWFGEAEGDHYEETRSVSADAAPLIEAAAVELLEWEP